ncbi:gliding motility-associated C-terminal domain-containing protein [Chitinophaga oryzae]|uniref:Gliding motility-associated C-terminal domain-containing protein n=1 Tax=Chitinophaga oryzae TaxID=2725414 RepID=A0ABX6LP60_9BACT|nr:PKD domain-containing protein [Chitinophaga oryzae]QJB41866.1 gliding motility-associated C-terminal domain-containing protein [Chitinophaga oryzae]
MKKITLLLIGFAYILPMYASHIIGGQIFYKLVQSGPGANTYQVTMKLYRICESGDRIAEMPATIILASFDKKDNSFVSQYRIDRNNFETKQATQIDPCIINPPRVCFQVGTYQTTITLPNNADGYTIAFQSCCRDPFMMNIVAERIPGTNDRGTGATYFAEIPGTNSGAVDATGALKNSGPAFTKEEAILVCADKKFTYDFSATDADGDQLEYEFCDAYTGGQLTDQSGIPPAATNPPYRFVQYISPFSGQSPLGPKVTIDRKTGIISGTAPAAGKYVVTVCVNEYRNGKKIGTLRKDFHITVTTCVKQVTAAMPDKYADCSSLTITFLNNSTLGKPYTWDFGDGTPQVTTTSANPLPHTYAKEGTYYVKLYVDKNSNCGDSALATVYAYPKFDPDFRVAGLCTEKPSVFTPDVTRVDRGIVSYYKWDFGTGVAGDTSNIPSPRFQYKQPGTYNVQLFLRSTVGCEKTVTHPLTVYDRPPFRATADTLLCYRDSLRMWAASDLPGTYQWTPDNYKILNPKTPNPIVFPRIDTAYTVRFTDQQGCTNDKRILVDVRDSLLIHTQPDSTVCTGDEIHLTVQADGAYAYQWTNLGNNQVVSNLIDAFVTPAPPQQTYEVVASLGKCHTADTVSLKVVDPPKPVAYPDTTICFGTPVLLRAEGGAYYRWSPSYYVKDPTHAMTLAYPEDTTRFTVTVTDTLGCPKKVTASALVRVVPKVRAFAGNDTIVMLNVPFRLQASGGVRYTWAPVTGLNDPKVPNPVTMINRDITYTVTAYSQEGCSGTDDIFVRFIAGPEIYIPNAFSPNGDGQNDVFRPIPVGMVKIDFFRVFDRWGKLMYDNTAYMKGWDGRVNGQPAAVGTYVWVVQGRDVDDKTVLRKGTVTLVR